jgi:hypothetical protein
MTSEEESGSGSPVKDSPGSIVVVEKEGQEIIANMLG